MRPYVITVGGLAAADANGIAESQTPLAGGALDLDGILVTDGVAELGDARRVLFTFAGDESSRVFVVTGTDRDGNSQSETVAGTAPGTTYTVLDFLTVTEITIDDASAGAIEVGTNGIASSAPAVLDLYARSTIGLQCSVSGTVNYTVQQTLDSPFNVDAVDWVWVSHPDSNLVGASTTQQGNYAYGPPSMTRVLINSGTGTVTFTVNQPGIIG